jgi:branched-chain amino acid transport system substrate-binding protein
MKTTRRGLIKGAALIATTTLAGVAFAQDVDPVKIGYAASVTGRNAAGAGLTTIPTYKLWVEDVNAAGGLTLPDGSQRPVELIEYDDRSETQEVVRAIERLATQDEVDFILPPWGTGFNMAVAPLMDRFGYPQLATTSVVLETEPLVERWPGSFWLLGTSRG